MFLRLSILLLSLFYSSYLFANMDKSYIQKYCIAFNNSYTSKVKDYSLYAYGNIYNNKNDLFFYVNYFHRIKNRYDKLNNFSWGLFYDYSLSKKYYIWTFIQGEYVLNSLWNSHQIAGGLGFYLINNKIGYITINNGILYKPIINNDNYYQEYRYLFRIKSRIFYKNFYFETYNYIQPNFKNLEDVNLITFNTLTYRIYKKLNFKIYHWLSYNDVSNNKFQYLIFGISFENW